MAGITNVDFSEYEIAELGIRISPAVKADILQDRTEKMRLKSDKNKNKRNGIRIAEIFGIHATGHAC